METVEFDSWFHASSRSRAIAKVQQFCEKHSLTLASLLADDPVLGMVNILESNHIENGDNLIDFVFPTRRR
jgi:hypothetical protein